MVPGRSLLGRARTRVRDDLRADPYLPWLLALATLLCGFWFWHRLPNTATRDEWSRILDPFVAFRSVVADPSFAGLQEGVAWGRVPFGATFYVFGLALLPMIVVAVLTGQFDAITAGPAFPAWEFGRHEIWARTPAWFWTGSLALVRLFSVATAVGSVYLTYRIGTATADRATGRLAALLLTLTFGFLTIAHEGGEDMPALFFALLALYLLLRYVRTGDAWRFFAASAAGGVAIAFKLTAVPVVLLIGAAHLLRALRGDDWPASLYRPRLLATGVSVGVVTIALGFPTFLVGAVDPVVQRVVAGGVGRATHPTGPDAPIWWWFLRGYTSGLGLPLLLASIGGVAAAVLRAGRGRANAGTLLVFTALVVYVGLFAPWHDFRVHHLLPTFPLLALLVATALRDLRDRRETVGRVVAGALVVSAAVYAGAGAAEFASMPRDEAVQWLESEAGEGDTVEVYRRHFQDTAVPHGMSVAHAFGPEDDGEELGTCPEYVQLGYRDLLYFVEGSYYRRGEAEAEYVRALLDGEHDYEIAAEFGPRPPDYVPQRPTPGSVTDLVRLGVVPHTDQYADEQELAANQYTVVLEATGETDCRPTPPF